jgi:dienelactone hydrolase
MFDHHAPVSGMIVVLMVVCLGLTSCSTSVPSAEMPVPSSQPARSPSATELVQATATTTSIPAAQTTTGSNQGTAMNTTTAMTDGWSYEAALKLFDYDQQAPLDLQETETEELEDVTVHHISYASPKGGRVRGYMVVPSGPGPFAGVIIQHGMPGSRDSVRAYAEQVARTGAVVLAIDAPFARRRGETLSLTEKDREEQIQLMIDLRRGVDALVSRTDVDANRLGYIGFSYGGAMGGLLAGIEKRIKAFVLAVGDGGLVEHLDKPTAANDISAQVPQDVFERWKTLMEPIEPIRFVGYAAPAALLFQNARSDESVNEESAKRYQEAGSEPKEVKWYDGGHRLSDQAHRDQVEWLQAHIGIDAKKFKRP